MTQTRDVTVLVPLISADLRAFIDRQCEGLLRATAHEIGLMATNLRTARHSEPEVMRLVENLCITIRIEKEKSASAGVSAG